MKSPAGVNEQTFIKRVEIEIEMAVLGLGYSGNFCRFLHTYALKMPLSNGQINHPLMRVKSYSASIPSPSI